MIDSTAASAREQPERTVVPCNFRASGLLSNESLRNLRSTHETLARMLSHSLDLSLGATLDVKFLKVDQVGARDFGEWLAPGSYLVPFSVGAGPERVIARFDNGLLFPMLDLLLGGTGEPYDHTRELTEIDEELFRSVTELMCVQLERVWKVLNVVLAPQPSVKLAMLTQMFAPEDRVVVLDFDIQLGETESSFAFVLPMTLATSLVRNSQTESSRRGDIEPGTARTLRNRLMNCRMRLSAELAKLHVPLGELVALEPGSVVDLRVPAQTPVHLRIAEYATFEVIPVRRGDRKAAQLVRPLCEGA